MSVEDVRTELADEVESLAAVELLAQILAALEPTPVPVRLTCATVPTHTSVAAGGRIGDDDRELTVAVIGEEYDHYPSADRPLSLAEVADHINPRDGDYVLLLEILRALAAVEDQVSVEAVAPAYWRPEAIVRTPNGDRLTIATG